MSSQAGFLSERKTILIRIPNASVEEPSRISIDKDRKRTVKELADDIQSASSDDRQTLLKDLIPHLLNLSDSELFRICESLLQLQKESSVAEANLIQDTLRTLITNHIDLRESISLGAQVVHFFESQHSSISSHMKTLAYTLSDRLQNLVAISPVNIPNREIVQHQVLIRCLESPALRPATSTVLLHLLNGKSLGSIKEQKSICKQILQIARRISDKSPTFDALRRKASHLYIGGENFDTTNLISTPTNENSDLSGEARSGILIEKIIDSGGKSEVQRLLAQDFHTLRCVSGLEVETFSILTSRLLPRAITEPWARAALLDIVRAPHAASVSLSNRTNVLGSLVAEARRHGVLNKDMEQEILSTSARLPENLGKN